MPPTQISSPSPKYFHSNGKLLLTGEYAVLDGALSLALPTRYGQSLTLNKTESPRLTWKSVDHIGNTWFEAIYTLEQLQELSTSDKDISRVLYHILSEVKTLNPTFLKDVQGMDVKTVLTFPKNWGLGTSSTLINTIAQWAGVDAYSLLQRTFGGSGYDIACAQHDRPILFQLKNDGPEVKETRFTPSFKEHIYFVYLNKKQNSREGIAQYRQLDFDKPKLIQEISELTIKILNCENLTNFETLIAQHETIVSKVLGIPPVKERLFSDYTGAVKSLGAWGGDFVLATGDDKTVTYFEKSGYDTIIPFDKMIL